MSKHLWILDNGHGKDTKGKRSPVLPDGQKLLEYKFNRIIVKKLIEKLDKNNISWCNLVPGEYDAKLKDRVDEANKFVQKDMLIASLGIKPSEQPKPIYLSIHANAYTWKDKLLFTSPSGIETYHYPNSIKGKELASKFQRMLIAQTDNVNRGVKTAKFYVLKHTKMPAILVELGFYTNKEQCIILLDETYQNTLVNALYEAISNIEHEE